MKGLFFLLFALMIFSIPLKAATTDITYPEAANIKVTLVNQEPNPVEPGEHLTVRFRIENLGSGQAQDIFLDLDDEFPFSVVSEEKNIGTLSGLQKERAGALVDFDVIVDPRASEGTKEIFARYKISNSGYVKTGPYNISIKARQAALEIAKANSIPEEVIPGDKSNLTLLISNVGRSTIKNLQIKLDLSATTTPFAPFGAAEERTISQLQAGASENITFGLISLPSATAGVYKIPIKLSYFDQVGKNFSRDDLVSLTVGGKPSIIALVSEQDTLKQGKTGEVTVQIINNGLVDIKLMTIELKPTADFDIVSPSTIYIGNLESDDFDTSIFKIYVKKESESIKMPITISYMDANNRPFSTSMELAPKLYINGEAAAYGLESKSITGFVIAAIIVAAGLIIYLTRFRKKE